MASTRSSEAPRSACRSYRPSRTRTATSGCFNGPSGRTRQSTPSARWSVQLCGCRRPSTGRSTLVDDFAGDMTLTGQTLESVVTDALRAVLITGRVGLYVDFDLARQRAYLRIIQAPGIPNWAERADKTALTAVVIADQREEFDFAEFTRTRTDRLRALQLNANGHYMQRVFEAQDPEATSAEAKRFEQVSEATPKLPNGQAATAIPFVFAGVGSNSATPDKPPMLGLTDTSIALFRNSALLERALDHGLGPVLLLADQLRPRR